MWGNYNFKTHTRKSTFREVLWGPNWQRLLSSVEQGLRAEVGVWFLRGCGRGAERRGRRCGGVERGKFVGRGDGPFLGNGFFPLFKIQLGCTLHQA